MISTSTSRIIGANAPQQAAIRHHYYAQPKSRIIRPPVAAVSAAFAAVPATVFVIEIPAPESGLHSQAHHDLVGYGTEFVILFVVFVLVLSKLVMRVFRQDGTEVRLS